MQSTLSLRFLVAAPAVALLLFGAGCATPPQPASPTAGFSVIPMAPATYRITYQGDPSAPADRLLDLALLRACELLKESESSHFAVIDEDVSTTGNIAYCAGLTHFVFRPDRGLVIQCFPSKPKGLFTFDSRKLLRVLNEKLNLSRG